MSIAVNTISKTFGATRALNNVSLNIPDGKLVALLGPSGSGKTTLLRIMAGLELPDPGSGSISFHGEDVSDLGVRERKVGMVFQHYALFRHMTVARNIAFGLNVQNRKTRLSKEEINQRVDDLLEKVQLVGYGNRLPHQLSGGQRQRVALARALAIRPRILFLDEPFGALDAKVRKELRRWLRRFHQEINLTTVFVTHDQDEALELADEVVVMNSGRIEQAGQPQDVYDYPESRFVIEFMGSVNRIRSGSGNLNVRAKDELYVRPHDVEILTATGRTGIDCRILHVFAAGSAGRVTLERLHTRELIEAEVPRATLDKLELKHGQEVGVRFRHIRLFAGDKGRGAFIEEIPDYPDYI